MDYYWQTTSSRKSNNDGIKIIAAIIILMVVISTGLVFVIQMGPFGGSNANPVRVAVLDSGINIDFSLQSRVVAQESFIDPQYGYDYFDTTVTDSQPEDVPHGTLVAKLVAETPNTLIINAKVLSSDGAATSMGIIAAMQWAIEQNCSVITMSLGSDPLLGDPIEDAINWAFSKGVVVVASAGNEGDGGLRGTSISSPSVFDRCISVGALYESGTPAEFSSTGPTYDRYMKPDISAYGWASDGGSRYYGTSFAAPRVAGAAALLIGYSDAHNFTSTPGSIMTALMKGATPLTNYPSYIVGAGLLNVQNSLDLIENTADEGGLPAISLAFPGTLPIDYETLFLGDTYEFNVRLLTSGVTTFDVSIDSESPEVFDIPSTIDVNQTLVFPMVVNIPSS
ncbi:MAG: S8 family serine peptidase, partial [Candidatus Thorarchaeota archaeon]